MSWIVGPMLGGVRQTLIKQLVSKRMVIAPVDLMVAGGAFQVAGMPVTSVICRQIRSSSSKPSQPDEVPFHPIT